MEIEAHIPNTRQINRAKDAIKMQKDTISLQGFVNKFNNDWSMTFAGALAYSLLTAIVPILLAILSILGFILGPSTVDYVTHHLKLGSDVTLNRAVSTQLKFVFKQLNQQASIIALIAVATAIFGGSRLFIGLEGCLDIVYRAHPRKIVAQNVMAILMIILFIILVPIMIFAATLPGIIQSIIASNPFFLQIPFFQTIANNTFSIWLAGFAGGLSAAFLLFWAIYLIVPNQKITLGSSWQGALVSAFALEIFITIVFPFYITRFMGNYAGQAGLAIILLVFFYYFAVILMLGAEVNAYFCEKIKPLPNDLATFVSTMAGTLNKDIPDAEAPSHVNPQPTETVDQRHIAEAHIEEQERQQKDMQQQNEIFPKEPAKQRVKKQTKQKKIPREVQTLISAVFGSLLAMVIELLQKKRHRH